MDLTGNVSSPNTNAVSGRKLAAWGTHFTKKEKNACDWREKPNYPELGNWSFLHKQNPGQAWGPMRCLWRGMVGMVVQQCECTYCHWYIHLKMVKMVRYIYFTTIKSERVFLCCDMEISPSYYPPKKVENIVYCALTFKSRQRKHAHSHCLDDPSAPWNVQQGCSWGRLCRGSHFWILFRDNSTHT